MWLCHINKDTPLPLVPPPFFSCLPLLPPPSLVPSVTAQLPFLSSSGKMNRKTVIITQVSIPSAWFLLCAWVLWGLHMCVCVYATVCVSVPVVTSHICPTGCLSNHSFWLCHTFSNKNMTDWWRQHVCQVQRTYATECVLSCVCVTAWGHVNANKISSIFASTFKSKISGFLTNCRRKAHKSVHLCTDVERVSTPSVIFNPRVCSAQTATCQTNTPKTHKLSFSPACFDLQIILLHSHSFTKYMLRNWVTEANNMKIIFKNKIYYMISIRLLRVNTCFQILNTFHPLA